MAYDNGTKFITAGKLRELLAEIPPEFEIEPNAVGNLSIYAGPGQWRGYIDLNHETVEMSVSNPDA